MAESKLKYKLPNKAAIIKAFEPYPDINSFVNWYEDKHGKKPTSSDTKMNQPDSHLTLQEALNTDQPIGLAFQGNEHNLIALDIDGVSRQEAPDLSDFCLKHPTYEEASPSGKPHRRRRLYALMSAQDKEKFENQAKKHYGDSNMALYVNSGYTTLTGQESNNRPIALISVDDILAAFPEYKAKLKSDNLIQFPTAHRGLRNNVESLSKPEDWVNLVPCDQNDPRVRKFMAENAYGFRDFWLTALMALQVKEGTAMGLEYADKWSRKDPLFDSYPDSENQLLTTWASLSEEEIFKRAAITERTYQLYYNYFNIDWKVRNTNGTPKPHEILNLDQLMDYYELEIKVDALTHIIYLDGPPSALYPRFYKNQFAAYSTPDSETGRLGTQLAYLARVHKMYPDQRKMCEYLEMKADMVPANEMVVRFAVEIDKHERDTETDYLTLVARDIVQHDPTLPHPTPEFHITLIKKWLLSVGRTWWRDQIPTAHRDQTAEGILILSSPVGKIGKSSFGKYLFPPEWQHLYLQIKPRFGNAAADKDYKMATCTKAIVTFDEGDGALKTNSESDIKSETTAYADTFRASYGRNNKTYLRRYSNLMSTNETMTNLPRNGSRRFWWTHVKFVDIPALLELDRYKLWAEVRHQLINADPNTIDAPWMLTDEERKYLENYLNTHRTENNMEKQLMDKYDFSKEGYEDLLEHIESGFYEGKTNTNNPLAKLITRSGGDIQETLGIPKDKGPALMRALLEMLKRYAPSPYRANQTNIVDGCYNFRNQPRYFMPNVRARRTD